MTPQPDKKRRLKAFDPDDIAYVKRVEKELKKLTPAQREERRAEMERDLDKEIASLAEAFGGKVVD